MGNPNLAPRGAIGMRMCNELDGLLRGIRADTLILPAETARIAAWLQANRAYSASHPFDELATRLQQALSDGELTLDEIDDLLFVISKYTTVNPYFDQIRAGLQVLMGLLSGYASDAVIPEQEVRHLQQWIEDWGHLKGLWPYDECETIVTFMIARGRITEHAAQLLELSQCVPVGGAAPMECHPLTLSGICTVSPDISFRDRRFVFTGESQKCSRTTLEGHVLRLYGIPEDRITKRTDYLIVCDVGNPHWAFSCYGRKVERAFELRREGHRISIVHESDFWDALVV